MSDFLFTALDDLDLDNSSNWNNADVDGNDLGGPAGPPTAADNAWFRSGNGGASGTLNCLNYFNADGSTIVFSGGTYVVANGVTDAEGPITITGGTFNCLVSATNSASSITSGDFTDLLIENGYQGSNLSTATPTLISGTFSNLQPPIPVAAGTVLGRMTLDGSTYFYPSGSTFLPAGSPPVATGIGL